MAKNKMRNYVLTIQSDGPMFWAARTVDDAGRPAIPAYALNQCLTLALGDAGGIEDITGNVTLAISDDDCKSVKLSGRRLYQLDNWCATFRIDAGNDVTPETLSRAVSHAGARIGLGAIRPGNGGQGGRFSLVALNELAPA